MPIYWPGSIRCEARHHYQRIKDDRVQFPVTPRPKKKTGTKMCLFGSHQYSDGRSSVVRLRSAYVMIQSLVPFERVYAESSRKP